MKRKWILTLIGTLFVLWGGACSPTGLATPHTIAVSPLSGDAYPQKGAAPEGYGQSLTLNYNTDLELSVWNVEDAVDEAAEIAREAGGYQSELQIWVEDGQQWASLKIAVPSQAYDNVRARLRKLGSVVREASTSYPAVGQSQWEQFSQISLQFRPRLTGINIDTLQQSPSRPARTFYSALSVFTGLFALLLDAAIWIIVVLGPFALLGWAGRRLWQQQRGETNPSLKSEE